MAREILKKAVMDNKSSPKFTIILPVKNGGVYLRLCVDSILTQSYQDFNLVILENQSQDGTPEWLEAIETKESRIKVIRSQNSLSIEGNWKRISTIPKNEFMTIIGHDDLLDINFLEEINKTIKKEPEASLYTTHFRIIDREGKLIRYCTPMPAHETAAEFLATRMAEIRDSFGTGYVMRSEHFDRIGGIPAYPNLMFADDALWMKLIKNNYKATSSQVCFSYRLHPSSVSGTPKQDDLFQGLKQYLILLRSLANDNADINRVIKLYGPQYIAKWCQSYIFYLIKTGLCNLHLDLEKLKEIKMIMKEFACETILDKTSTDNVKLQIKYYLYRLTKNFLR